MQHSPLQTVLFTAALCLVFSVLVSMTAVSLKDRQDENVRLDRIKNVLGVAGLKTPDESLSAEEMNARFADGLEARLVDLGSGEFVEGDALGFDQRKAAKDAETSVAATPNPSKVQRVPNQAVVYLTKDGGVVLPIEGYGLWGTLYGFLALEPDLRTVRGITYYEHKETPGLGGEVSNERWKAKWPGRLAFDDDGATALSVRKGAAGPPESDPYHVDGLSGATITSRGVTNMLQFWLGREGFGQFLAQRAKEGGQG